MKENPSGTHLAQDAEPQSVLENKILRKRENNRRHYIKNREKVLERTKKYQEKNRDKCKEWQRNWYEKNREKENKKTQKWREDNKTIYSESNKRSCKKYRETHKENYKNYKKIWREKNREILREYHRKWREKNYEILKLKREIWRLKNKEKINEYFLNRRKIDVNFLMGSRLRNRLYRVLKYYTKMGKIVKSKKYGIDWNPIVDHLVKTMPPDFKDNPKGWHIDHKRPCCSFDLTDPEQIKQCFSAENLQWLPAYDNISKGGKYKKFL